MRLGSRCCKASAWLVLIAMWFACLAPTAALAFSDGNASDGYWTQLCSMNGSRSVWVDAGPDGELPDGPQAGSDMSGHCLFCNHHAALGLPPADIDLKQASGPALLLPRSYFHSPRPLFSWASHRTRGPPSPGHIAIA